MHKCELTQLSEAVCCVTQNAAVNCDLCTVEPSWHQAGDGDLGTQFTESLVHQNRGAVPQHDTVVVPLASGGRPADP